MSYFSLDYRSYLPIVILVTGPYSDMKLGKVGLKIGAIHFIPMRSFKLDNLLWYNAFDDLPRTSNRINTLVNHEAVIV